MSHCLSNRTVGGVRGSLQLQTPLEAPPISGGKRHPQGGDAREEKPDRNQLQTPDPLIPPRLTWSKDKTSDRNGVPHHSSPAEAPTCSPHGGPHQPHCSAQAGKVLKPTGIPLGSLLRAPKSQPVTLPLILTAQLGPASPNRTRSCNHTCSGRRKLPPATHTVTQWHPQRHLWVGSLFLVTFWGGTWSFF